MLPFSSPYTLVALLLLALLFIRMMQPRRFYFVRHGQSILNAKRIRQGAEGGLTEAGRLQAERSGAYLTRFPIRRILASPYERSRETAEIVNTHLNVPVLYSPLLSERRNPSEIIGQSMDAPAIAHIVDQIDLAYHEDAYRYSDEENFEDLKERAHKALELLSRQSPLHTAVVTHGIFLKMLIAYLLYRDRLHAPDYTRLSFYNDASNAGITICEYHPWRMWSKTRGWEVISYNELP